MMSWAEEAQAVPGKAGCFFSLVDTVIPTMRSAGRLGLPLSGPSSSSAVNCLALPGGQGPPRTDMALSPSFQGLQGTCPKLPSQRSNWLMAALGQAQPSQCHACLATGREGLAALSLAGKALLLVLRGPAEIPPAPSALPCAFIQQAPPRSLHIALKAAVGAQVSRLGGGQESDQDAVPLESQDVLMTCRQDVYSKVWKLQGVQSSL